MNEDLNKRFIELIKKSRISLLAEIMPYAELYLKENNLLPEDIKLVIEFKYLSNGVTQTVRVERRDPGEVLLNIYDSIAFIGKGMIHSTSEHEYEPGKAG